MEMVIDFRRSPSSLPPLTIKSSVVKEVESFKFLGTVITNNLKWEETSSSIIKRAHSGMFFLRQLTKLNVSSSVLSRFYRATVESLLSTSITVWFALSIGPGEEQTAARCAHSREADWTEAAVNQ